MLTYSANTQSRDRLLIAATWLIGLGSVFLVKNLTGWSWQLVWPLFIVYVGAAAAVTALINRNRSRLGVWAVWWPLAAVAVGIVLLLSTTGTLAITSSDLFRWWPIAVIGLGLWFLVGAVVARDPHRSQEELSIPLGGLPDAEIRLHFGGGELTVGQAEPGVLLSGRFEGGVFNRSGDPRRLDLESAVSPWPFWWDRPLHWDLGITDQIPVDLKLEGGASRATIDLSALRIRRLGLKTGASDTRIRLPAAGVTSFRAEAGMASVSIDVPPGVAARIRSQLAIASLAVDEGRFPRSVDGWASADYDTAANRVEIDVQGGFGAVRIS